MKTDYQKIINEYVDIHAPSAVHLSNLNEDEKEKILDKVATQLYKSIMAKVDDIDYGDIPRTAGNITKLPNYEQLKDAINNIETLLTEYNEELVSINIVKEAHKNVLELKSLFETGFRVDNAVITMLYNNVVMGIIVGTSHLLLAATDYLVTPDATIQVSIDKMALKNTKDNLIYRSLEDFNRSCSSNSMRDLLNRLIREGGGETKSFMGFVALNGAIIVGVILMIIPVVRNLIYFFYYSRVKMSDYLDFQAKVLNLNVLDLEASDRKDKKEIVKKQRKVIDFIEKLSDKIRVQHNKSAVKAQKEVSSEKRIDPDDIIDNSEKPEALF